LGPLTIGAIQANTPESYFDGAIDQVKISSIIPDAFEIAFNYVTYFPDVSICPVPITYDFNGNCIVDIGDFALMAAEWLNCNRVSGATSALANCIDFD
jgi:hypothetical protein